MPLRKNVRVNELFDAVCFFNIQLQRAGHRGGIGQGCLDIQNQPRVLNGLGGSRTKGRDTGAVLFKVREVDKERIDAGWTEKSQDIIIHILQITEIGSDSVINNRLGKIETIFLQKIRNIVLADIRAGKKKFFTFVFLYDLQQFLCVFKASENFPLANDNVFLQVIGGLVGDAEIFHFRRHLHFQFVGNMKKMINRIAACKDDRRVRKNVNFLLAKFLYRHRLHLDKLTEVNLEIKFLRQLKIRRINVRGHLLSDQDAFHLAHPVIGSFSHINTCRVQA